MRQNVSIRKLFCRFCMRKDTMLLISTCRSPSNTSRNSGRKYLHLPLIQNMACSNKSRKSSNSNNFYNFTVKTKYKKVNMKIFSLNGQIDNLTASMIQILLFYKYCRVVECFLIFYLRNLI